MLLALSDEVDDNFGLDDWPVTYGTPLHLAFMATDQLHSSLGRWPGTDVSCYDSDLKSTQSQLAELVKTEVPSEVQHCAQEMYVSSTVIEADLQCTWRVLDFAYHCGPSRRLGGSGRNQVGHVSIRSTGQHLYSRSGAQHHGEVQTVNPFDHSKPIT